MDITRLDPYHSSLRQRFSICRERVSSNKDIISGSGYFMIEPTVLGSDDDDVKLIGLFYDWSTKNLYEVPQSLPLRERPLFFDGKFSKEIPE